MAELDRALVLLSGGIDSLVVAEMYRQDPTTELAGCVFVDYGHPAQIPEGWKAFAYCGERGVPLKVIHAFGLDLGDMETEEGARVVPGRNLVLLALAVNVAKSMGATFLAIGANAADQAAYPDCRRSFLNTVARAADLHIESPLVGFSKRKIVQTAIDLGLAKTDAWSCYKGDPSPCGSCPSCLEADAAWPPERTP